MLKSGHVFHNFDIIFDYKLHGWLRYGAEPV